MRVELFGIGEREQMRVALAIRRRVFVEEQGVPLDEELDEHDRTDPAAVHALAYDGVQAVGTGRFYALDARTVQLGRMAVLAEHRGKRAGAEILGALEAEAIRRGFERAHLWAQMHAIGFYGRAGFAPEGDTVWDGGILHQPMSHTLGGER